MKHRSFIAALALNLIVAGSSWAAPFVISTSTSIFTPSYRGQADTYYFGWASGTFDGSSPNSLLDDPQITLGQTSLDPLVNFSATPGGVLSSTGNLYKNGTALNATLVTPVAGTLGSGFTTIIVQGNAVSSPYGASKPVFGLINGIAPDVVIAANADTAGNPNGRGQFWAKYEIPGNLGSYTIPITGAQANTTPSIAHMVVDVLWSPSGFASDTAVAVVVPEPTSLAAIASASMLLLRRRVNR